MQAHYQDNSAMIQPGMMQMQPLMMQPGMTMQPGMMMDPNSNLVMYQTKWGWEKLAEKNGIFIKQKFDFLEVLSGCERENKYHIYPLQTDGDKKGRHIFKAREKSSWCARNCMRADCRPFNMLIFNQDPLSEEIDESMFMKLGKPYSLTCCCWNRPAMTVTNVEKGANEYLGQMRSPWLCCELGVDVYNNNDSKIHEIRASCLQTGVICNICPCDSCQHVHFEVKGTSGETVSTLEKRTRGCIATWLGSDADEFSLTFPPNATKEEKALLMAAVLLLDFSYFENNSRSNQL